MSDENHAGTDQDRPPPPPRPDLDECCGGGCNPCIFDLYEEALERWRRQVAAAGSGSEPTSEESIPISRGR